MDAFPLLAGLPRIALAKLLPDVQNVRLAAGDELRGDDAADVYLIRAGTVLVLGETDAEGVPVGVLGAGDLFPDPQVPGVTGPPVFRAATDVTLYRLPYSRLEALAAEHPLVSRRLHLVTAAHLARARQELVSTRRALSAYADELWQSLQADLAPVNAHAAAAIVPAAISPRPGSHGHGRSHGGAEGLKGLTDRRAWGPVVALGAALGWLWLQPGQPDPISISLAILIWAGINWLFSALPDHVVALAAALGMVIFGLGSMKEAFAGFVSPAWWLLLAVMGVVAAVARTGLLYRVSLYMLRLLPPTYFGQSLALALTGVLATPVLPAAGVRTQMSMPLAWELADNMGFGVRSQGSAGLGMACYLGFSQMYFLFLNGTTICLLMWGLLPAAEKGSVSWGSWTLAALPMGIVLFIGFLAAVYSLYRPGPARPLSGQLIDAQLRMLGPMAKAERTTGITAVVLLAAFATEPLHGFSPVWAALLGFAALAALGILDRQAVGQMDWNLALFMGAVISLGAVVEHLGTDQIIGGLIAPLFGPVLHSPLLFLLTVAVVTVVVRLAVPPPLAIVVMTITLNSVAHQAGVSPFLAGLVACAFCGVWLIPAQWSVYMNAYYATGERAFSHRQVHILAWINLALLAVGILISIPYWRWLGLIQ